MISTLRGLTFDDVLLVPGYNGIKSRQDVSLKTKMSEREFGIPLASSNMDTITEDRMANLFGEHGGLSILHRFVSIEKNIQIFKKCKFPQYTGISIGTNTESLERADALIANGASIVCVDVAHGHSKEVSRVIKMLREKFSNNILIIGGNVATYAGADYLAAAGCDAIKVGIGPGSVCSTRIKTGYGVPQLTAINECRKVDRFVIADGGIKYPGDAVKALAAGADMVMVGGLLAGTDETPGEAFEKKNADGTISKYKKFRGMASREAQEDFMGSMSDWKTAEGVALETPCRGSASKVIHDLLGGIRSGLTYSGAKDIKELQRKAQFMEISQAAFREGTPHGLESLRK